MKNLTFLFSVILILLFSGCSKPTKIVGSWQLDKANTTDQNFYDAGANLILTLNSDYTFSYVDSEKNFSSSGNYIFNEKENTLIFTNLKDSSGEEIKSDTAFFKIIVLSDKNLKLATEGDIRDIISWIKL